MRARRDGHCGRAADANPLGRRQTAFARAGRAQLTTGRFRSMSSRRRICFLAIPALILSGSSRLYCQEEVQLAAMETAVAILPDQADWKPCPDGSPKGCEIALLHGSLKSDNPHVLYRAPAGSAPFPMFWHSASEHGVMIRGEFIGVGEDGNEYRVGQGTYWYIPAGRIHGGVRCGDQGPCVWYESFDGPWDSNLVDPTDGG